MNRSLFFVLSGALEIPVVPRHASLPYHGAVTEPDQHSGVGLEMWMDALLGTGASTHVAPACLQARRVGFGKGIRAK